jgi:nucleotide-binding universal stress UspA family protein
MRRILVGVDGSAESRKAAEYAAQIAMATHSGLDVAHVVPEIADAGPQDLYAFAGLPLRTDRAHLMLHEISQGLPGPTTPIDTSLLEGGPAQRLAEAAKRPDIWLVVVGHRGRGAVQRVLLGSVADRLVQLCPKPVLVVR